MTSPFTPTIAVFDSGFGGLTVLRALLSLLPQARYIYVGDTARLPYGSKSQETVARYALSAAHFLLGEGADILVVACNTATALALPALQAALPIPVIGVIEPGAQAAAAVARAHKDPVEPRRDTRLLAASAVVEGPALPSVLVLATAATVQSHAYTATLQPLGLGAYEMACPLLVPLVEEGWTDHHVTADVLHVYLTEALAAAPAATTLVLGCTHYPLLQPLIARTLAALHRPLHIVDAAYATAHATATLLPRNSTSFHVPLSPRFYATDSIEKFQRLGSRFLGQPLSEVHLLNLGG